MPPAGVEFMEGVNLSFKQTGLGMKTMYWLVFAMLAAGTGFGQTEKKIESDITAVTVFLSRAQVTRQAKARVEAGKTDLVLTGLTAALDQQSLQVAGKGNFIILGIAHRQNYLNEFNMPRSLRVLKDSVELLQRQLMLEQSQKEILNKEEQLLLSNQKIGGTTQNLTAAELKAMADFFRTRMGDIITTRMKHDEKIRRLHELIAKHQRQMNEQNELYGRNTSEVVVSVSAAAPAAVDLEVNYVVANAGWLPVYDLRATDTRSPIQLSYKANVFQSTGEVWRNVKLKLSTANPNLGGLKPELANWYVDFLQPVYTALEGRVPGVMIRGYASNQRAELAEDKEAEADMAAPAESVASYVSTIQTTLNTEFNISLPYTVMSSNKPTLVDVRNYEMKADYRYSVVPKLDQDAFLMARAIGWEEFSLLPGEANVFFEGTFVAKTFIDPNSIKDTLAVSLGRDKRIVVKREKLKDFTSKKFIGSNRKESYAYEISVRNAKSEAVKIVVEDQVPVSSNGQIEVTVGDYGGAKYVKDSGKLSWEITLQPGESKKVGYKFDVKYPKDREVAGL